MISFALGVTEAQGNDAKRVSGDKGIIQSAYKKRKKAILATEACPPSLPDDFGEPLFCGL